MNIYKYTNRLNTNKFTHIKKKTENFIHIHKYTNLQTYTNIQVQEYRDIQVYTDTRIRIY